MTIENRPSTSEIREGRLLKKIAKLQQQRDYHKQKHEYYAKVISMQPYLEKRYVSYEDAKIERQRVKDLEARNKEQAQLIAMLSKELHAQES
jgi:predicted restriction endonuclease